MEEQFFFDTTKIFAGLNPKQQEAVNCLDGALLIMAGAGSGKTRVLTCRIANLIAQGISPWNILAITFTNKAANEMKARAEKLIGSPARNIVLSTFHSFCARLLRREIEIAGKFTKNFAIYDAGDSKALIRRCTNELNLSEKIFAGAHLKISDAKNNLIDTAKFRQQSLRADNYTRNLVLIYELYQKKLQENNALDFDDLIFETVKLFREFPEVLERYQERFQYISIDEYQDTNVAQYVLTNLLAKKYRNICVVGDADQSIYGWRGADMKNILNFEQDYPEAHVVLLEQNYRSTKIILEAANAVIQNNIERKPKNLWTRNETGEKIKFVLCRNDLQEADVVAEEIQRLVKRENFSYSDIAILYRTNAQSRMFEEQFIREEIPYIIVGGLKFYDRKEIKDILAYLHVINNPRDNVHFNRIIGVPRRGIGSATLNRLANFAEEIGLSIFEVIADEHLLKQISEITPKIRASLRNFAAMMLSFMESSNNLSPDKLIKVVLEESGYLKMLRTDKESGRDENISREENLGEFVNSAKDFVELNPHGKLEDFLNHVALITDLDEVDEKESLVKLMTVHAAKGLEFPAVFVVGMEDGLFPHANSLYNDEDLEEERRACYVALTRAEKKLYITAAKERMVFGKAQFQEISRFVEEIPSSCLEYLGLAVKSTPFKIPAPVYRPPTAYRAAQIKIPAKKTSGVTTFNVGDQISHKLWGFGTVMAVDSKTITISFANPSAGVKKLLTTAAPIVKI